MSCMLGSYFTLSLQWILSFGLVSTSAGAVENGVKKVPACEALLNAAVIGFSQTATATLNPSELMLGVDSLFGDWVRIGSVVGGLYINLVNLESTDLTGYKHIRDKEFNQKPMF